MADNKDSLRYWIDGILGFRSDLKEKFVMEGTESSLPGAAAPSNAASTNPPQNASTSLSRDPASIAARSMQMSSEAPESNRNPRGRARDFRPVSMFGQGSPLPPDLQANLAAMRAG